MNAEIRAAEYLAFWRRTMLLFWSLGSINRPYWPEVE